MRRLPDAPTTEELAAVLGWEHGAILQAVAYGQLLGAVLREDEQLEVSRDAVHAWLRLDWLDGERRRQLRSSR